ncbi:unnamed protein product [Arctogadus glacialis]
MEKSFSNKTLVPTPLPEPTSQLSEEKAPDADQMSATLFTGFLQATSGGSNFETSDGGMSASGGRAARGGGPCVQMAEETPGFELP